MKISKVDSANKVGSVKKKKAAASDGDFADQVRGVAGSAGADSAQATESATSAGAVDSIFAVQEVPDAMDERSRKVLAQYGDDLLGRLDELHLAILAGVISKDKLAELAQKLRAKRQASDDPRLNEIIEEIELRCEVEVAKFTRDL